MRKNLLLEIYEIRRVLTSLIFMDSFVGLGPTNSPESFLPPLFSSLSPSPFLALLSCRRSIHHVDLLQNTPTDGEEGPLIGCTRERTAIYTLARFTLQRCNCLI